MKYFMDFLAGFLTVFTYVAFLLMAFLFIIYDSCKLLNKGLSSFFQIEPKT